MQGQRSTVDSFPGMEQESTSSSTSSNHQNYWNNRLNPVESQLSDYILSSSEANFTYGNAADRDIRVYSGWSFGESSSTSLNRQCHIIDDGAKMEHTWSSSCGALAGASPTLDEGQLEPSDVLSRESADVGLCTSQVTNGSLLFPSSTWIPQNLNLNAGYVDNGANHGPSMLAGGHSNHYKTCGLETEDNPSAIDNVGTFSGSSAQFMEENDVGSSSSAGWGLSCKRKALEGISHHSYSGGSLSRFPQDDWHTIPDRYDGSGNLNMTTLPTNTPGAPPEHLDLGIGVGIGSLVSDGFPSSRTTGNAETAMRNLNRTETFGQQQESALSNLPSSGNAWRSNAFSPHQSSQPLIVCEPLDVRSIDGVAVARASESQSHVMHIPGYSRNVLPFPWNGSSNSRMGSSSNSINLLGERGAILRETENQRNHTEHPMFFPSSETRNVAQDPRNWGSATRNGGNHVGVPAASQTFGSSVHTLPTFGWISNHNNSPAQTPQRSLDLSSWSLSTSVDFDYGRHSVHSPSLCLSPSATSEEIVMPAGSNNQGHNNLFQRSASSLVERRVDDDFGPSHSSRRSRALAVDFARRHRGVSEDYVAFDPSVHHGMVNLHDRHRDMRLDVDNMTYEELLALGEHIGDVKTGLSEETILILMEQRKFAIASSSRMVEPCCICQEEYTAGDDLGTLPCGHDFHTDCIKQWLMQKNLCPICKTTALIT